MATQIAAYALNRDNWSGADGSVILYADGTVEIEDIGLFRFIDHAPEISTPGTEGKYDYFGWGLYSADGQWSTDYPLCKGGVFRGDLEGNYFSARSSGVERDSYGVEALKGKPYHHHRAVAAARVLWNTV